MRLIDSFPPCNFFVRLSFLMNFLTLLITRTGPISLMSSATVKRTLPVNKISNQSSSPVSSLYSIKAAVTSAARIKIGLDSADNLSPGRFAFSVHTCNYGYEGGRASDNVSSHLLATPVGPGEYAPHPPNAGCPASDPRRPLEHYDASKNSPFQHLVHFPPPKIFFE